MNGDTTTSSQSRPTGDYYIRDNLYVRSTPKGPKLTWTPWKSDSELAMIRDWFFPEHALTDPYAPPVPDLRREAVAKVSYWEDGHKDLPHSISTTASLTDALLHDTTPARQRLRHISDTALSSILAMAFCRFVNGFVDRDVAKSSLTALASTTTTDADGTTPSTTKGESSMYALAGRIGMPQRFVDVRHQITHEKMPEHHQLAELVGEALEWVFERWWKLNAKGDSAVEWREWRDQEERREEGERALVTGRKRDLEEDEDLCVECRQRKKRHFEED